MFAVKGWSVEASSLKPQAEVFKLSKTTGNEVQQDAKASKKRKRGDGQGAHNEDLGSLWDQHIEGREPVKSKNVSAKASKKERKSQKLSGAPTGANSEKLAARTPKQSGADGEAEIPEAVAKPERKANKKHKDDREKPAVADVEQTSEQTAKDAAKSAPPAASPLQSTAKLTPMQAAMRQKLVSARFRHLNQTLYTAPSATSLELFDQNPEMFEDYHTGFRQQVSVWSENPLDKFIANIRSRGIVKPPKFKGKVGKGKPSVGDGDLQTLPRTRGTSIIADLGCGDARLSQTLKDSGDMSRLNIKVHSFDLHSPSPLVTKCDIANLPFPDGAVDVALFCLALMGTNWTSFIEEAYRILHWKGELWVAEIKSRFGRVGRAGKPVEHSVGSKKKQAALKKVSEAKKKEVVDADEQTALRTEVDGAEIGQQETDVSAFVDVLRRRGFLLKNGDRSVDLSNKMFVKMEFVKAAAPTKGKGVVAAAQQGEKEARFARRKFVDEAAVEEVATDDEAKVLKPCLYKIR